MYDNIITIYIPTLDLDIARVRIKVLDKGVSSFWVE